MYGRRDKLDAEAGREMLRRLQRWVSGSYLVDESASANAVVETIVVESADHVDALATSGAGVGDHSMALVPTEAGAVAGMWSLAFEGSAGNAGEELAIAGAFFIQTQDYVSSAFLPIAGPAMVRICTDSDYVAFLDDADIARTSGIFPDHLTHPLVQLGDLCALGTHHRCAASALRRLYVTASGEVRTTPSGATLGTVTDGVEAWQAAAGRLLDAGDDPCLLGAIAPGEIRQARASRPWLSRYLYALEGLRQLAGRGVRHARVSGFGLRLIDGIDGEVGGGSVVPESPTAPLVLWSAGESYLFQPAQTRLFKLGRDAAQLIEIAGLAPSAEVARDLAARHLQLRGDDAARAIDEVVSRFSSYGVDVTTVR